ncbi:hypothetical protein NIES4075_71990 [Tolypothrix sp. NIES-4075]|uniref:hypothetical protein n=1 Tax=Tolypothrix sp. NIES-4075 TaxID=2005459 RepID=UPI000B5C68AA|nr:hypothetical protein [Tolypothrix sp. NIES-4075]GAX46178.1 hypothetical protein NIES4075_71990 [Tolypothrix sp. NIES-4075]
MSSRADKYIFPTSVAALGGALIVAPLFIQVPSEYATFATKKQLASSEEIQRDRIQQRKTTAELIQKTGLLPEGKTLRLIDYDNGTKRPRIKSQTLQHYLADEIVFVYDRSNICAGRIQDRKFVWKGDSSTACKNAPVINSDN